MNQLSKLIERYIIEGEASELLREIYKKGSSLGKSNAQIDKLIGETRANLSGFVGNDIENLSAESGFVFLENPQKQTSNFFVSVKAMDVKGAMSQIFEAKLNKPNDRYHGQKVILKRIHHEFSQNPKYQSLFLKEYQIATELEHNNIVKVLGKGKDDEGLFYYMNFIDGRTLTSIINNEIKKDNGLILYVLRQVLSALSYAHKKQIFHRDLKPDNILVTYKGDNARIIDFGLAAADSFDEYVRQAGTPRYAAPEQMQEDSQTDQRSDIYSFGLIMLEMFTGQVENIEHPKQKSVKYKKIIRKCTQQNPNNRYHSADEILRDLSRPYFTFINIKYYLAAIATIVALSFLVIFLVIPSWKSTETPINEDTTTIVDEPQKDPQKDLINELEDRFSKIIRNEYNVGSEQMRLTLSYFESPKTPVIILNSSNDIKNVMSVSKFLETELKFLKKHRVSVVPPIKTNADGKITELTVKQL